jgi:hypothetical protein
VRFNKIHLKKVMKYAKTISLLICSFVIIYSCSSDDGSDGDNRTANSNNRNLGASANELLSANTFNELVIELAYVDGFKPNQASITNLTTFLAARLNKPNGIRIVEQEIPAQAFGTYTIEEVRQVEDTFRTQFNNASTIAVFILFAEQDSDSNTGNNVVLGTAYRNTSLVMFQKTIEAFSGGINQPNRTTVETAVYEHEFGHILGLVNIGTPLQSSHEDTASSGHCNVADCLMQARLESGNIIDMMSMLNNGVPQLDAQCIADLRANGGR